MDYSLQRMLLIVLILSTAISISIGDRDNSEYDSDWGDYSDPEIDDRDYSDSGNDGGNDSEITNYLRDLCSDTKKSKQCWKIIKPEINRFTDTDSRNVASVVIDLAIEKSHEINDKLNQLHSDSEDDSLKKKYKVCSKDYNDANHKLEITKGDLDSDDYRRINQRVNDVAKELKSCKHQFGKKSFDPAHIRDRNKEFGRYVEIIKAATKRFVRQMDDNNAKKMKSN